VSEGRVGGGVRRAPGVIATGVEGLTFRPRLVAYCTARISIVLVAWTAPAALGAPARGCSCDRLLSVAWWVGRQGRSVMDAAGFVGEAERRNGWRRVGNSIGPTPGQAGWVGAVQRLMLTNGWTERGGIQSER
jgi:hypothetical protein